MSHRLVLGATAAALVAALGGVPVVGQQAAAPRPPVPDISYQVLVTGLGHPSRWLTFSGDYTCRRHSPLTEITPANVHRLAAQWTFQPENMVPGRGFEGTPLTIDGTMYITGNNNTAWAIDIRTGRQLWRYRRALPPGLTYGAGNASNRGFGILGNRLFMTTLDAHLLAFDRDSGKVVWDVVMDDYKLGHAGTLAWSGQFAIPACSDAGLESHDKADVTSAIATTCHVRAIAAIREARLRINCMIYQYGFAYVAPCQGWR